MPYHTGRALRQVEEMQASQVIKSRRCRHGCGWAQAHTFRLRLCRLTVLSSPLLSHLIYFTYVLFDTIDRHDRADRALAREGIH